MLNEDKIFINRCIELSERSYGGGYYTYSDFLDLAQQSTLSKLKISSKTVLIGGYEGAERRIACFGDPNDLGYDPVLPAEWIEIKPLSEKFSENLTHRDFLGSILGLGLKRNVLGDILINNNTAYVFCLETVARYITEQLVRVRNTDVSACCIPSPPENISASPDISGIIVSSERIDNLICAVYKLSRSQAQKLFSQDKVFADGRLISSASFIPSSGARISVRGYGRFIFEGTSGETRKGRLKAIVRIFR